MRKKQKQKLEKYPFELNEGEKLITVIIFSEEETIQNADIFL